MSAVKNADAWRGLAKLGSQDYSNACLERGRIIAWPLRYAWYRATILYDETILPLSICLKHDCATSLLPRWILTLLVGAWDTVSTRNLIVKTQSPNKDALKTIYRTLASVSVLVNHQNDTHQYRYLCVGMRMREQSIQSIRTRLISVADGWFIPACWSMFDGTVNIIVSMYLNRMLCIHIYIYIHINLSLHGGLGWWFGSLGNHDFMNLQFSNFIRTWKNIFYESF